jgi:hypothetical protein
MFRYGDTFGGKDGARVLQAGVLDVEGVLDQMPIVDELFVGSRVEFVNDVKGSRQCNGMPPAPA